MLIYLTTKLIHLGTMMMISPGHHDREESVPSCLELLVKLCPGVRVHVVLDHLDQMRRRLMHFEQLMMMNRMVVMS